MADIGLNQNITINQSGDLHIDEYLTVNFTESRH